MLLVALALVAGLIAAWIAHELTHLLAARLLGVPARLDGPTTVVYELDDDRAAWRDRLIGIAPQLTASAVAIGYLALRGVPSGSWGIAGSAVWALYAWGSWEDVSLAAARGETPWMKSWFRSLNPSARLSYAAGAASLVLAGVVTIAGYGSYRAGAAASIVAGSVLVGVLGAAGLAARDVA